MAGDLTSSRKRGVETALPGHIQTPEVPEVNKPQYDDAAQAAVPKTFGGQGTSADPTPFALRGTK